MKAEIPRISSKKKKKKFYLKKKVFLINYKNKNTLHKCMADLAFLKIKILKKFEEIINH